MDGFPPALLTGGGLTGVLALLIVAFIKGWIHVGSVVERLIADKDKQISLQADTIKSLTESVRKYAVSAETSAHAIHELEQISRRKAGGD